MAPFRPPGRSNRSGRAQADNDIFEGLPVKQWTHTTSRISLAPPVTEIQPEQGHDRWAVEPPMPRDYQLLQPWTQQMLRLARSGKVGQKRKSTRDGANVNGDDSDARDEDANHNDEPPSALLRNGSLDENRAFVAKKWRHVPDHALVPEHLHWEFLAKRRKGLPSFYYGNADGFGAPIPTRKTRVSKVIDPVAGEVAVYDVIVPEGQSIENEVVEGSEFALTESTIVSAGTTIDGIGIANDDGVLVMEVRNPAAMAQRRNRPPPKKKGGPGRGKKRVTFTNPDGSTYTTVVPNATKIVPQPGQTVKHVAKGEEAARDITAEEAANMAKAAQDSHGDDDDGDDDEDEEEDGEDEDEEGDEEGEEAEERGDAAANAHDQADGEIADQDATMQDMTVDSAMPAHEDDDDEPKLQPELDAEVSVPPTSEAIPSLETPIEVPAQGIPDPDEAEIGAMDDVPDAGTQSLQTDVLSKPPVEADVEMTDGEQGPHPDLDRKARSATPEPSVKLVEVLETSDELPETESAVNSAPLPDESAKEAETQDEEAFVLPGITTVEEPPAPEPHATSQTTDEAQNP